MKLKDISNLTKNKANSQFSLNLKAKQLKKIGLTPEHLLNLKLPKNFILIKDNLKGGLKDDNNRRTKSTGSL